jgi:hypothetical protein
VSGPSGHFGRGNPGGDPQRDSGMAQAVRDLGERGRGAMSPKPVTLVPGS